VTISNSCLTLLPASIIWVTTNASVSQGFIVYNTTALWSSFTRYNSDVQCGSEYRTSLEFKWSILPRTGHLVTRPFKNQINLSVFNGLLSWTILYLWGYKNFFLYKMVYFEPDNHLKTWHWFVWYSIVSSIWIPTVSGIVGIYCHMWILNVHSTLRTI
jgi:hypothetical protein